MNEPHEPIVLGPDDGERIDVMGDRYRFLATREGTAGTYGLWEAVVMPGGGPPPHVHSREEEGFYVVEGELTVYVGDREVRATAGSFVNMPVGVAHRFRNNGDRPARMLILVAPGGLEAMFRRTGTPVADPTAPIGPPTAAEVARVLEVAPEYGVTLLGPPPH
jgi:mannose-6-phosphate isomerase-like protein (cupin superfamily)